MKTIFSLFLVLFLAACGGGSDDGGIPATQALAAIQSKLDEESNKLMIRITTKSNEANDFVGTQCTSTHIDLAQTMVSTEIMQGLDEFNRWMLAYQGATPSIKYEIGRILDDSTLPSRSAQTYLAAIPCSGYAVTTSAYAVSQSAVSEVISVRDSLRRAGLLGP